MAGKYRKKKTVIVGMSGGVDSSVAAALLVRQGLNVIGVFMKNWTHDTHTSSGCSWEEDYRDMRRVCQRLSIPYYTFNFEQQYRQRVFQYFLREYRSGRTPNPDVMCNTEIKFRVFLERARDLKADWIATGHYARKRQRLGKFELLKGADQNKDQTYFIHHLTQRQLKHILFPIGHLTKPEVRRRAKEFQLPVYDKPDSQGICFIGKIDFRSFLNQYIPSSKGPILTTDGKKIGNHIGLAFYTIGQRTGLGIGGKGPYYVVGKHLPANRLVVAQGSEHPALFSRGLIATHMHWISGQGPARSFRAKAKIRYRQPEESCLVEPAPQARYRVLFRRPQRAITPGQFVVLYRGANCLGGGVIAHDL